VEGGGWRVEVGNNVPRVNRLRASLPNTVHARPFECYPVCVLGAFCPFLEPFCGHLSPKDARIFKIDCNVRFEGPCVVVSGGEGVGCAPLNKSFSLNPKPKTPNPSP